MKKLLATGLIASVAMASAESSASCGNGGFYVGANFGLAFTKAKATNKQREAADYTANSSYGIADSGWTIAAIAVDQKHITAAAAAKRSELAVDVMKNNKTKLKSLAELVLGYDFRLNDVMIGVELNVGGIFGTSRFKRPAYNLEGDVLHTAINGANVGAAIQDNGDNEPEPIAEREYAKIKEQGHIAFMPRVGYLFTPQFEGYVTFGVKLAKFKTEVDDVPFIAPVHDQGNGRCLYTISATRMKKKSTKAVFLAGAGVRYEFNPSMFAKLEYNFEFGAKPKLHSEAMPELQKIKVTSHTIKLGLGYRF